MRKPVLPEVTHDRPLSFFELPEFATIVPAADAGPQSVALHAEAGLPDKLLAGLKWIFLYVPGVAWIHMILMGFALTFFYKDFFIEMLIGSVGAATVGSFLIMFGMGRLNDLRYLRVVGSVLGVSAIAAVVLSISIVLVRGDYFGRFALVTLLISMLAGVVEKRKIDREPA